jgi:hypothetical protein
LFAEGALTRLQRLTAFFKESTLAFHFKGFRQAFERSKRGVAAAAFQMAEIGAVHARSLRKGSLG